MAEGLTERLEQLEKSVRRAAETITRLRKERDNLQGKVAGLEAKLQHAEGERAELDEPAAGAQGSAGPGGRHHQGAGPARHPVAGRPLTLPSPPRGEGF